MAADTKDRIVAAAANAFQRQGYAGSGLKQISSDSGAPFGSLYHFFPGGKEELAEQTLRTAGRWYQELVEAVWNAAGDDVVRAVTDSFAGAADTLRATDYADACPIATVALEVASTNDRLRRTTAEVFEAWLDALAGRLTRAGIAPGRSRELSIQFIAALEGGFLLSRAAKDTTFMEVLGRAVADQVQASLRPG